MDDGTVMMEISYEDDAGNVTTTEKPITLYVSEEFFDDMMMDGDMMMGDDMMMEEESTEERIDHRYRSSGCSGSYYRSCSGSAGS